MPRLIVGLSGAGACIVGDNITQEVPLRPLTSLKWPYVPDENAYPDPLKRDDPKPLQTAQYEAIGSSTFTQPAVSNDAPKLAILIANTRVI